MPQRDIGMKPGIYRVLGTVPGSRFCPTNHSCRYKVITEHIRVGGFVFMSSLKAEDAWLGGQAPGHPRPTLAAVRFADSICVVL